MTSIPATHRAIRRATGVASIEKPLALQITTEPTLPEGGLGPHDVLIKIIAVSLNFRDPGMLRGPARYLGGQIQGGIAGSDASALVTAIGSDVTLFSPGDRVQPTFDLANLSNNSTPMTGGHQAIGGDVDGILREFAVFDETHLVRIPGHLSDIEAATLGCASVTAWNALDGVRGEGEKTVLVQGTGGVSMFAVVFARARGWKVIVTSGRDAKLEGVKAKYGVEGYNYRNKGQVEEVMRLTGGRGVDYVLNNRGPGSVEEDIGVLARKGTVSLVGFTEGFEGDWKPSALLGLVWKDARIQGIAGGSKEDFEEQNRFLEEHKVDLSGLVDAKVFTLEQSQEAFDYLYAEKHVGKVVIRVSE